MLTLASFLYGVAAGKYKIFPYGPLQALSRQLRPGAQSISEYYGRWFEFRKHHGADEPPREAILESLGTLPYLQGYTPPRSGISGVVNYDRDRAFNGATLFSSGHAPTVYLIGMEGEVLHAWTTSFDEVWPQSVPYPISGISKEYIRRAYLYPNGDLLCLFEYIGLVKLDKDSRILWSCAGRTHHDLKVAANGEIYTLGRKRREIQEYPGAAFKVDYLFDDLIVILSPEGEELKTISILDAFHRSEYAGYLNFIGDRIDVFHANSIHLIENPPPPTEAMFQAGDILISMRNIHTIAVIDGREGTVKWALTGKWRAQHQAELLGDGSILLFDNQGANLRSFFEFNRSKVIEIEPFTQQIVWEYRDDEFFSEKLGYNQRLPNGNTLITESHQGHIFEVTPEKEVVWSYYNPHRAGKNNELIATIMGATRIDLGALEFLGREE